MKTGKSWWNLDTGENADDRTVQTVYVKADSNRLDIHDNKIDLLHGTVMDIM